MNRTERATPTVLSAAPLAEAWAAPPDFTCVRETILHRAKAQISIQIADGITAVGVAVSPSATIGVLASPRAKPHVDADFPEWSALWVLQAYGHHLGIADHVPTYPNETTRRPLRSPGLISVPLQVDSVVLFNAHRTHWMDSVTGRPRPLMFAASFDFSERPNRQAVEARIRAAVASA
jgi:hypothetical protein